MGWRNEGDFPNIGSGEATVAFGRIHGVTLRCTMTQPSYATRGVALITKEMWEARLVLDSDDVSQGSAATKSHSEHVNPRGQCWQNVRRIGSGAMCNPASAIGQEKFA